MYNNNRQIMTSSNSEKNRHIRKNCVDITRSVTYDLILNGVAHYMSMHTYGQYLIIDSELVYRSYFN